MKKKTVLSVTFSNLLGFLFFILLLLILNMISFQNQTLIIIINFLNKNLGIIILFSIFLYIAEIFNLFTFPLNTPTPVFNAIGGIFLASFIFNIFYEIGKTLSISAFYAFRLLEPIAFIFIFLIIIILGYINIFSKLFSNKEKHKAQEDSTKKKKKSKKEKTDSKKNINWEDVGEEFKLAMYNLASRIKENLEPNKKKKNKAKKS
jgi:signal transduction histidine kinase